jgi:CHAT domain-containing protein/tetratricopeptide (TPR) repeat protein
VTDELLKLRRDVLAENDPSIYRTLSALGSLHAKRARAARMRMVGDEPDLRAAREDVELAKEHLKAALQFWRTHQPRAPKDLASALNYYAEVLRYDGQFRDAEATLNEVAAILDSTSLEGFDDLRLAEFYTNRAAVQAALGQYYPAQVNYERASDIAGGATREGSPARFDPRTVQKDPVAERVTARNEPGAGREVLERRRLLAMIELNLAQLYKSQRQFGAARRHCEEAVASAEKAGIRGLELAPFQLAQASLLIAEAEHDASAATRVAATQQESDEDRAKKVRQRLEEAIGVATPVASSGAPLEQAIAGHLEALARYQLYELCGGDGQHLQEAERIWTGILERSGDALPQIVNLRARAANYLVAIALRDAAASRRLSLELIQGETPDERQIAEAMQRAAGRLQQAEAWSRAGEQAAEQMIAYPAVRIQSLLSRALVLNAQAQVSRAKAKAAVTGAPVPDYSAARKMTDDAVSTLQEAVTLIEMPRAMTVGAEGERALYFAQFAPVFDLLVDLLVENGRYMEAIQTADLRRSRTFQDQLRACGVDLAETAEPELARAAKDAAERYYAKVNHLKENWSDERQRQRLSQELETLRGQYVQAERDVKSTSVAARQLLLESGESAAIASDLRADQWADDEVAIIYYVGAGKSYVFACGGKLSVTGQPLTVTPEQARLRGLRAARHEDPTHGSALRADQVAQLVRDVRAGVEKLPDDADRHRASRGSPALALSYSAKVGAETDHVVTDILLPPELRRKISDARPGRLIVIPDGALHQLPLELLPFDRERTRYVLDEMPPISYAPSLLIERKLRAGERSSDRQIALLSVADPNYRQATATPIVDERAKVSAAGEEFRQHWGGGFARLEGFQKESLAVCAAFESATSGQGRIVTLREADATERKLKETVRAGANQIGFLHVAAHGLVSQEYNNLFGALALTPPDELSQDDDGYLSLHEVFGLKLRSCEMVVLSACDTNRGAESPLEAGSTMARAFICAGATRVVCSHWGADDDATTALVSDFMKQVSSELSADRTVDFAAALHSAKKKLRGNTPSPYFWAPFVLIGPPSNEGIGEQRRGVALQ